MAQNDGYGAAIEGIDPNLITLDEYGRIVIHDDALLSEISGGAASAFDEDGGGSSGPIPLPLNIACPAGSPGTNIWCDIIIYPD